MDILTYALAKKKAKAYTDEAIAALGKGVIYKGAVNYYDDLPNNPNEGECYTVLYKGTTGSNPYNMEYVWGKLVAAGSFSWIKLGADDFSNFIEELTQDEYDALVSSGQVDPNVYYYIEEE